MSLLSKNFHSIAILERGTQSSFCKPICFFKQLVKKSRAMSVNMKNIPSSNRAGLIHNCLFSFDGMMMWRWDWNLGPHSKSAGQTNRQNLRDGWDPSINWLQISKLDFYLQLSCSTSPAWFFFAHRLANPICWSGFWHPADEVKHSKLKKPGFEPMPSRIRIRVWCNPGSNPYTDRFFKGKLVECEKIMQLWGLH